jgi:serine/threonine protein kinase
MPLAAGTTLNSRYRLVRLLGQGGFGVVYRAWDINLNKPCAVKENLDASEAAQTQFMQEASLLGTLRHPNLPVVIDHFFVPGQGQYLVMDFVEGEDLRSRLKACAGPLPTRQAVDWIGQVWYALAYMHARTPPVIQRDIKPANIRVTPGAATAAPAAPRPATQLSIEPPPAGTKVFGRVELTHDTDGVFANPFDSAQAGLQVRIAAPGGQSIVMPPFWYQAFNVGSLHPLPTLSLACEPTRLTLNPVRCARALRAQA